MAVIGSIDWNRPGMNLEVIARAGRDGLLTEPLTELLVTESWADDILVVDGVPAVSYLDPEERPIYEPLFPKSEELGAKMIDVSKCDQWFHDEQKSEDGMHGSELYNYLLKNRLLDSCYGLDELYAIQKKGTAFFRRHFQGKVVHAWRGISRDSQSKELSVPGLCEKHGDILICWTDLKYAWCNGDPALREPK